MISVPIQAVGCIGDANIKDALSSTVIEVMNPYITDLLVDVGSWLRLRRLGQLLLLRWLMWRWSCDGWICWGILSNSCISTSVSICTIHIGFV